MLRKAIFFTLLLASSKAMGSGVSSVGIANRSTLQSGAVFNVSSGTVAVQLTVSSNVAVGALATAPAFPLDVGGDLRANETGAAVLRGVLSSQISSDLASAHFGGMKARGTPGSISAVQADDYITALMPSPYDGTQYLLPGVAGFRVAHGTVVSNGIVDTDFVVNTSSGIGDGYERLRVDWTGHVGINQTPDSSGAFAVTGFASTNAARFTNNDASFATVNISNGNASGVGINSNANMLFSTAGTGILGQTNNTGPASTLVGYQTSCQQLSGTNFPTSDQYGDVCSITLTAGTWELKTMLNYTGASVTGVYFLGGVGTVTGNNGTGITQGSTAAYGRFSGGNETVTMPGWRTSINSNTTYYFKVLGSYTVGTPQYVGTMTATRVY